MNQVRSGDVVFHRPSRERWVVAYVDEGQLAGHGWPFRAVPLADCVLLERASDDEHERSLRSWAERCTRKGDPRIAICERQLLDLLERRDSFVRVRAVPVVRFRPSRGAA
ncbi:MAG TPA: hypothetical protein VF765_31255 [Polyangiaceae bacterium]